MNALNLCRNFSRGILVFINVLFVLLGSVLVSIGGYMMDIPDLYAFSHNGLSTLIIICGVMMFLIAILGCCGAHCDSKLFLCPYASLVLISIIAQLILAGFMFHMHTSLLDIQSGAPLSKTDTKVLMWVQNRFYDAYEDCDPQINLQQTLSQRSIALSCRDRRYQWFVEFAARFCKLKTEDLNPSSFFMKCAGTNVDPLNFMHSTFSKATVFCACETRIVNWVNDQSSLIGMIALVTGVFEIFLVCLSCLLMCSTNTRGYYREIRMPIKQTNQRSRPHNEYPAFSNPSSYGAISSQPNVPYAQPIASAPAFKN